MKKLKLVGLMMLLTFLVAIPGFSNVVEADEVVATPDKLVVFKIGDLNYYTQDINSNTEVEKMKMDVAPLIINDRTFVPVRFLGYALGLTEKDIDWDNTNKVATMRGKNTLKLKIGSVTLDSNGKKSQMDVAPILISDRTLLPARYVAEGLGYTVEWDNDRKVVVCYPEDKPKPETELNKILEKIEGKDKSVKRVTIDCRNAPVNGKYERDKYPEFILGIAPNGFSFTSKDESCYRFVCTNYDGLNETYSAPFGSNVKQHSRTDKYCYGDHTVANGLGYLTTIEKGMTIKYDIFNEDGKKIYEMTFQM